MTYGININKAPVRELSTRRQRQIRALDSYARSGD